MIKLTKNRRIEDLEKYGFHEENLSYGWNTKKIWRLTYTDLYFTKSNRKLESNKSSEFKASPQSIEVILK